MIDFYPYPFWTGLLVLGLFVFIKRKNYTSSHLFSLFVFGFYILMVMGVTLFPIPIIGWGSVSPDLKLSSINLEPFNFGRLFEHHSFLILRELVGNILMTIPFGFGINFITKVRPRYYLPISLMTGLVIEITQFIFTLLFVVSYRSVDINDVILNFSGSLLGFVLFYLFALFYLFLIRRTGAKPGGFLNYMQQICCRGLDKKSRLMKEQLN